MQLTTVVEDYVYALMQRAVAESLDDGTIAAIVPEAPGVVAVGGDRHECAVDLYASLEEWVRISLQNGSPLPVIDGIDLNREEQRALADLQPREPASPEHEWFATVDELEAALDAWSETA